VAVNRGLNPPDVWRFEGAYGRLMVLLCCAGFLFVRVMAVRLQSFARTTSGFYFSQDIFSCKNSAICANNSILADSVKANMRD
jgi:hypothetical protein